MKVGSADPQEDVVRARAIREEIGEDNFLMMDANQKWGAIASMAFSYLVTCACETCVNIELADQMYRRRLNA